MPRDPIVHIGRQILKEKTTVHYYSSSSFPESNSILKGPRKFTVYNYGKIFFCKKLGFVMPVLPEWSVLTTIYHFILRALPRISYHMGSSRVDTHGALFPKVVPENVLPYNSCNIFFPSQSTQIVKSPRGPGNLKIHFSTWIPLA